MNKMLPKRGNAATGRRKIAIEPLEERILLSVDLIPYAPDDRQVDIFYERQVEPVQAEVEQTAQSVEEQATRELVILDSTLGDLGPLQAALSDIGFGGADNKTVAVVGSREDVIAALSGGVQYDAIHWISHGSADGFQIGDELLSTDVGADDPVVQALARSMRADSDLMLYACDLADGGLPQRLAVLTGADVAASTDTTGSEGDWLLEAQYGDIETQALNLGDAIAALGTSTDLVDYFVNSDTPVETVSDIFGAGGLYEGAYIASANSWRDLANEVTFGVKVGTNALQTIKIKNGAPTADNTLSLTASSTSSNASIQVVIAGRTLNYTLDLSSQSVMTAVLSQAGVQAALATLDVTANQTASNVVKFDYTPTDPLEWFGTNDDALEQIVGIVEEAALKAGREALADEVATLPFAVRKALFAEASATTYVDGSPSQLNTIMGVIANGDYLAATTTGGVDILSVNDVNRLAAAFNAGAETINYASLAGSDDSDLVSNIKSLLANTDKTNFADRHTLATKRIISLFSKISVGLTLGSANEAADTSVDMNLELNGSWENLPVALTNGYGRVQGAITLSKTIVADSGTPGFDAVARTQTANLEMRAVTTVSANIAVSGQTDIALSNVPNVAVPACITLGGVTFDVTLDATSSSLAAAVAANADFVAAATIAGLTVSASGNVLQVTNSSGSIVALSIVLNKTGVRSATVGSGLSETVTFAEHTDPELPVRFQIGPLLRLWLRTPISWLRSLRQALVFRCPAIPSRCPTQARPVPRSASTSTPKQRCMTVQLVLVFLRVTRRSIWTVRGSLSAPMGPRLTVSLPKVPGFSRFRSTSVTRSWARSSAIPTRWVALVPATR
jgi:hypothetical protein